MQNELYNAIIVLFSAFGVSAFAGLATTVRFSRKLSKISIISGMLNSGLLGLAIALTWYQNYRQAENVFGLLGVCVLAGMGGSTLTDFIVSVLGGAGVQIIITQNNRKTEDDNAAENT